MVETVIIKDKINSSLEMNTSAIEFLEDVKQIDDSNILIDFEDVVFVSRGFAQAYFSHKNKINKNINEINIPESVKHMMEIIKNKFE